MRNDFYDEVEQLMQTEPYIALTGIPEFYSLWRYHYYKSNYKEALKLINENTENLEDYNIFSRTYAQLGDRKKLDSINKIYFLSAEYKHRSKAVVHAIFGERDSMYFYMEKLYGSNIAELNIHPEYRLYRNEERFKVLLREQYIPILGE